MSRTKEAMALRRGAKFEEHGIEIKEENRTEVRRHGRGENAQEVTYDFTHAVYVRGRPEARTFSRRSALKRAHQIIRNRRG